MFLETPRFPDCISSGARGGPGWATTVQGLASGHERRNQRWARPRYEYAVGRNIMSQADLNQLVDFFNIAEGMTHGFRFKDFREFTSGANNATPTPTDQTIGTGDGTDTTFQLRKVVTVGARTQQRDITKPVDTTVRVALDGVEQGAGVTVDTTTGIVTFATPPANGVVVSAGFEFDVPVRFDVDQFTPELLNFQAGSYEVPLIEIRDIT